MEFAKLVGIKSAGFQFMLSDEDCQQEIELQLPEFEVRK